MQILLAIIIRPHTPQLVSIFYTQIYSPTLLLIVCPKMHQMCWSGQAKIAAILCSFVIGVVS